MRCRACGKPIPIPAYNTWTICLGLPDGSNRHEVWFFGPGSTITEAQAEVAARGWLASERKRMYPTATVRLWRLIRQALPAGISDGPPSA